MDSTTPNRRVQKFLDAAVKHGWTVEHPTPELATWLVHPSESSDDGFVVYGLPNDAARVVRRSNYKPVTQREARHLMAVHEAAPKPEPKYPESPSEASLDDVIAQAINLIRSGRAKRGETVADVGYQSRVVSNDENGLVVETEFAIPEGLPEREKSQFCEGALLCATTVSRLMRESVDTTLGLLPEEVRAQAQITPSMAAHVYLHLAAQLRDPKTLRMAMKGLDEPGEARLRGAQMVCVSLTGVWTAFADGLFALDSGDKAAPVDEFMKGLMEHADFIRDSADESFGPFITASDDDFESLLGA
jgi:hypothetical protein